MPKMVDKLTDDEKKFEKEIRHCFSEEQMCAYFLTKTTRSLYQFDDDFVLSWYQEIFEKKPDLVENTRIELVQAYAKMLMVEKKYKFHLDYWLRQYQQNLITEMQIFFTGEADK